jgi:hypothetical protein
MWTYIREGWSIAWRQPFLLLLLFLYQFGWGFLLYRFVHSVMDPVLHRYPGQALPDSSVHLFFAESEFRLLKTDLSFSYIGWLCALLLLRMLLTPVLNAGILFSLHQTSMNSGYRFIQGIKRLSRPFLVYYLFQIVLTLLPLYWLIPKAMDIVKASSSYTILWSKLLPLAAGMILYAGILQILCLYVMLQRTTGERWGQFWRPLAVSMVPMLLLTLCMVLIGGLVSIIATGAAFYWAGLTALLIYQLYHFAKIFMQLWQTSSQYQLWMTKQP